MTSLSRIVSVAWQRYGYRFLPFADAATPELPLGRLPGDIAIERASGTTA